MRAWRDAVLGAAVVLAACQTVETAPAAPAEPAGWTAVIVAADDAQPVFDNARLALRDALVARGVPPDDIVTLSADPAAGGAGAATLRGIDQALGFAGVAEPGAGCLLYLTSHGGPEGLLLSAGDGAVLSPGELDALLDRHCAKAPTVAVISGCYTGVFVEPLAAPNRIVLTAARSDRPSFGCGADEVYTVYDACFLVAFRQERLWTGLYDRVAACVAAEERRRGVDPSGPQAKFGAAVGDLALPGAS